jgi:hypothetical protein
MSLLFSVSLSCDAFFLGSVQDIFFGGLSIWRAIRLEGCVFFVCVILSFFLSPWLDQLSLRYQMVYAIFLEIIIPIPYSILYVIYDLEGSNDVNLQSTEFDPCR